MLFYEDRSGSTWFANMLARHPKCLVTLESNIVGELLSRTLTLSNETQLQSVLSKLAEDPKFQAWDVTSERIMARLASASFPLQPSEIVHHILAEYISIAGTDPEVLLLKQGDSQLVRAYQLMWPEVRFLSLVRDGRAVYASRRSSISSVNGQPLASGPLSAARRWRSKVLTPHLRLGKGKLLEVKYEDLISNTEECISIVLSFLAPPTKEPQLIVG